MRNDFAFKREPGKQRGVTYVLIFWSLFSLSLVGCFFLEGIAFFSTHPTSFMNDTEFFVALGVVLASMVAFLLLVNRNFRIRFHWGWAIALTLLFACNVVGTFLLEWHVEGSEIVNGVVIDYNYTFTMMERVRYLICFGVVCLYLYLYFVIFPKCFHNFRRLHFLFYLMIVVALAAIVYSLIMERELYATMFNPNVKWRVDEVKSFTNNPNSLGFIILCAMFSVFMLHNRRSHWWWIALMFFFATFQLLIGSGSACLASWALLIAFVIYRFCVTLKYYTGRSLLWFFIFWAGMIALAILIFAEVGAPTSLFARIGHTLKVAQFSENSGHLRLDTWNRIMRNLDTPLKKIFGIGDFQSYFYLAALEGDVRPDGSLGAYYAHSGYMQQIISGGFIRLAFYIGILARYAYFCIKSMKRKTRVAWPCFICMGALLLRGSFESTSLLQWDVKGAVVLLLIGLPLEVDEFLARHPEVKGYEEQALPDAGKFRYHYDMTPLRMAKLAFLFLTPIVAIGLGVGPQSFRNGYFGNYGTWTYYALFIEIFLLVPFGAYCIGHHADHQDRRIFGTLLGLAYAISCITGIFTAKDAPIVSYIMVGVIPLLTLFAFLLHARSVIHFREPLLLHAYLPHLILCGALIGLCNLGYLIPPSQFSLFNPIMMAVGILVLYVCVLYTRWGDELTFPLGIELQRKDCRRTALGIPKENALVSKQEYYLKRGHIRVGEGKTLYHRY